MSISSALKKQAKKVRELEDRMEGIKEVLSSSVSDGVALDKIIDILYDSDYAFVPITPCEVPPFPEWKHNE
jgi:hypothetical protein